MAKPPFDGHRTFTWFTPRRRAATEYELYTVGQQSSPEQWLHADWPIRFDDGREPYTASSTAIRCGNWPDYRDPAEITRLTRDVRDLRLRLLTRIPSASPRASPSPSRCPGRRRPARSRWPAPRMSPGTLISSSACCPAASSPRP